MPGEHLLVIDDSPTLLKVVEIALTKAGYRVDTALDGNAGLALVREKSTVPDLILLDGTIPSGDSAEICRRLAATRRSARSPWSMATKERIWRRAAKATNVVDYISKPPAGGAAGVGHTRGRSAQAAPASGRGGAAQSPAASEALARCPPARRRAEREAPLCTVCAGWDLAVISMNEC
jgi:CheY-like chemotaxis protein